MALTVDAAKNDRMASKHVYLDYNATTPLEKDVLDAINKALAEAWGNPSSQYDEGKKAKALIEKARESIGSMVGGLSQDVVFTSGGTEANNMVIQTAVQYFHKVASSQVNWKGERPHIITSNLEHDSIKLVLEQLVKETIADVSFVPASTKTGRVEVDDVVAAIRPTTILITVMMANNETGIIQPISEICEHVRQLKRDSTCETSRILLHSDAAQTIGKIPVDKEELGIDYLTIVGHKFYGPRIGALYVNELGNGTPLYPMLFGGGQERNFRPGTENTGMIAGLGKAAELVVSNIASYEAGMRKVRDYLEKRLEQVFSPRITFNGRFAGSSRLPNTCNVSILGSKLQGSCVLGKVQYLQASVGAACHSVDGPRASPILLAVGIPEETAYNAIRLSVGRHTTMEDIDLVVADLQQAVTSLEK